MPECFVVDIDGTLSDLSHRLHYIKGEGKKDWDSFFGTVRQDTVNTQMRDLVNQLSEGYDIVLCSGRPERCRNDTNYWLAENHIISDNLYMRKDGDYRPDYVVKEELLKQIISDGFTIKAAIDDRKQVVDMWRRNGILCLQCAEGDF